MRISAKTKICLIIGDPVGHSLSPAMHNAGYEKLGIDDQFVFAGVNVKITDVKIVIKAMRTMNLRGITCTIPHKIEVMRYLDWIDPVAKKIGAANTVINDKGILRGFNTDWLGVIKPLEKMTKIKGKKAAVLGAGGAARAAIYGLVEKEAKVTIFNRTVEKAVTLAKEFNCRGQSLDKIGEIKNSDIIINSTSIGMRPLENETPVPKKFINDKQIVFDIVYVPFETKLLKEAKERGAAVIRGVEMLLHQGTAQFELYTGQKAPLEVMRKVIYGKH